MPFTGGPVNVLGITPSYLTQLGTEAGTQAGYQVWKGAGKSFGGGAGQALTGSLAGSAVNIALNSLLGTEVSGPSGISLTSGDNVLASVVTPYLTASVASEVNKSIETSLSSAGPFGPVLAGVATGLVNQITQGITESIAGNLAGAAEGEEYSGFPGGGGEGEAPANYGGSTYSRGDVVFSIQSASQGPEAFGSESLVPGAETIVPSKEYASIPKEVSNQQADLFKRDAMSADFTTG